MFGTGWLIAVVVMPAFPGAWLHEVVIPELAPYFIAGMAMFLLRRTPSGWRWLSTAGVLRYPFYLLHQRIGYSLIRTVHQHTSLPAGLLTAGAVVVMLAAAWLVHRLIERPLAPLLRRSVRSACGVGRATGRPAIHP